MALITVGAVAVGLVVVVLASGVLGAKGGGSTGQLLVPIQPAPSGLVNPANARALGASSAPVTIDVWSDFQCPYCSQWSRLVTPALVDEYVKTGKVQLVYRDFAFIDGGDPSGESQQSASAARCAAEQGKFWPYHDYLLENQNGENKGGFSRQRLDEIATAVGLDMTAFGSCMGGDAPEQAVKAETDQGKQVGIASTPTLVINGVVQRAGAIEMADTSAGPGLRTLIDAALAAASPAPSGSAAPSASPAAPSPTAAP